VSCVNFWSAFLREQQLIHRDFDIDSARGHADALQDHTPTPFLSVESLCLRLFPCESILRRFYFTDSLQFVAGRPGPSGNPKSPSTVLAVVCAGGPSVSDDGTSAVFYHRECSLCLLSGSRSEFLICYFVFPENI